VAVDGAGAAQAEQVRMLDAVQPPRPVEQPRIVGDVQQHTVGTEHDGVAVRALDGVDPVVPERTPRLQPVHGRHYCSHGPNRTGRRDLRPAGFA
jgi:hypothetical protein